MDTSVLFPAFICGLFCYLGAIECSSLLGTTLSYYTLGRPLVAGLIIGLAFGDVTNGILCGCAVGAVFIANLSTGGATNSEITYASYGGIGLAMATTKDPAVAVTLSVLVGNACLVFYNLRMAFYSVYNHKAEEAAINYDMNALNLWQFVIPTITSFVLRFVPVFLAIAFGQGLVESLLNNTPDIVMDCISVIGGVLPAMGVAMLMNVVIKQNIQLIFFLFGFVMYAFVGVGTIPIIFIAAVVAYLYYLATDKKGTVAVAAAGPTDEAQYEDDDLF